MNVIPETRGSWVMWVFDAHDNGYEDTKYEVFLCPVIAWTAYDDPDIFGHAIVRLRDGSTQGVPTGKGFHSAVLSDEFVRENVKLDPTGHPSDETMVLALVWRIENEYGGWGDGRFDLSMNVWEGWETMAKNLGLAS